MEQVMPATGEAGDYRLGLERAAHECEWMARGYATYLMQPLLDAGKRIREIPDDPAREPHCKRRDGQVPSLAREPATADVGREGFVLMPARATRAMVDAADACTDAYEAYGKMVEAGRVR